MTDRRSPAWRLLILIIGAIALLGLVAAAACNDDDDGDGDGDSDSNGDPTATQDDGDGDGDSLANLADFGGDYDLATGRVTYEITNFTGADSGLGSMTIYQKDGSFRFDISSEAGDLIFISTPDASYFCVGGACFQYAPDDNLARAPVDAFVRRFIVGAITEGIGDIPAGVGIDVTSETIAGIDATCFNYSGDLDPDQAGDESGEFCFSDGGLLLRLAFQGADESISFEATSASEDVSDSDFDPPYDVTDLSDLGDLLQP